MAMICLQYATIEIYSLGSENSMGPRRSRPKASWRCRSSWRRGPCDWSDCNFVLEKAAAEIGPVEVVFSASGGIQSHSHFMSFLFIKAVKNWNFNQPMSLMCCWDIVDIDPHGWPSCRYGQSAPARPGLGRSRSRGPPICRILLWFLWNLVKSFPPMVSLVRSVRSPCLLAQSHVLLFEKTEFLSVRSGLKSQFCALQN